MTVTVNDKNDNPPLCSPSTYVTTAAELTTSASLLTLTCSDADTTTSNNVITYAITSGNTASNFEVNSASGEITVSSSATLDYESTTSYALIVTLTDSGTPQLTSSATVNIEITGMK